MGKGWRKYHQQYDDNYVPRSHNGFSNTSSRSNDVNDSTGPRLGAYSVEARRSSVFTNYNPFQRTPNPWDPDSRQSHTQERRRRVSYIQQIHHQTHNEAHNSNQHQIPTYRAANSTNIKKSSHYTKARSHRLKQHLISTITQALQEITDWNPDDDGGDDGLMRCVVDEEGCMDWQREFVVVIPQVEEVRYCWDSVNCGGGGDIGGRRGSDGVVGLESGLGGNAIGFMREDYDGDGDVFVPKTMQMRGATA